MKVVIDEGVPRRLARALTAAGTPSDIFVKGWRTLGNGKLLDELTAAGYTVLVTNDRNMAFQQNLKNRPIAVVALPTNRWLPLATRADDIADTIRRAKPGQHVLIAWSGRRWTREDGGPSPKIVELPPVAPFTD